MDSSDLVARCRKGDDEAFRELFRTHREDVARLVYRMTGSSRDLEDLVQKVFLRAMRRLGTLRRDDAFSPWLAAIARNRARDHWRRGEDTVVPFEAFDPVREWLAAARPDVLLLFYNDQVTSFFFDPP